MHNARFNIDYGSWRNGLYYRKFVHASKEVGGISRKNVDVKDFIRKCGGLCVSYMMLHWASDVFSLYTDFTNFPSIFLYSYFFITSNSFFYNVSISGNLILSILELIDFYRYSQT